MSNFLTFMLPMISNMKKYLLPLISFVIFSCNHDNLHEKLETYDFQLTVDSFVSVYEESARIKDSPVPIRITLAGNGNPYDNQYVINMNSELLIKGLMDKEYTIFANAFVDGTLFYKEIKFNPAQMPALNISLEGIVTKFKFTATSWPEGCSKAEITLNYDIVTMIDETAFYLNEIYTGLGQHKYGMIAKDVEPEYYYATPFRTTSIEVIMYDGSDNVIYQDEVKMQKFFEKLKSYNIKIDLAGLAEKSASLAFSLENLEFDEVELEF
jgi:hypothetical protein